MKILFPLFIIAALSCVVFSCTSEPDLDNPWATSLYLGHEGYWKQRIPVKVHHPGDTDLKGAPLALTVGKGKGKLPVHGVMAQSLRVTNKEGKELKCRVDDPQGRLLERGPVPSGSTFTFPLENESGSEALYLVYFDNEKAWSVGEYLFTHREVFNGGFETGGDFGPLSWELDWPEEGRDVAWSDEAHSGNRSLKVIAEGSGGRRPYGGSQENIHLDPGADYLVEAWFRTESLEGEAGLVLAPANLARTKMEVRPRPFRLLAGEGTGDWHRVELEFTAPEEVNVLEIGSFVDGSGKLWVDDISISCLGSFDPAIMIGKVERLDLEEHGVTGEWLDAGENSWPVRARITVSNFTEEDRPGYPVYVDVQMMMQRLFNEVDENTIMQLTDGNRAIPFLLTGHSLLFRQDIAPLTRRNFYLYFSGPAESDYQVTTYENLGGVTENLVENPFFDRGLEGWRLEGESATRRMIVEKEEGEDLARLSFRLSGDEGRTQVSDIEESHLALDREMGIAQLLEVKAGSQYYYSARVKSSRILDRPFTLRATFLDAAGDACGDRETRRANPDMHQNFQWVDESMIIVAPDDAAKVKIELVNTVPGDIWYDDVFFMEIGTGHTGAMCVERLAEKDIGGIALWEKPAVAKPFPDDLPDGKLEKLGLSAAGNDREPVQVLMRSREELKDLEIRMEPLEGPSGEELTDIEIGTVAYVNISYPSNYIRDFVTPFWQTILPFGKIGSDGWIGPWADPILPFATFDLPADHTLAAWIEVSVPPGAAPGIYTGQFQLLQKGKVLREIPVEMQVYDFTLPEESNVKATYVLRFNEREMFGRDYSEEQWKDLLWAYMAEHRVSSKMVRPEPEVNMVDGMPELDFTEFDKAAAYYFDTLKIASTWSPQFFYLFGWGRPPADKFGQKPYPGEYPYADADHLNLRPEYKAVYQSALKQYWDHMKEKGWADRTVIYISDEPHADEHMNKQMYAVCDMIHEVDPEIPIYVSTWWYRPEFEGYVDVWGVSHRGGGWGHPVPEEHLREAVRNGGDIFFTTDGMQCTDSPYLGFERMLPWFCFKYDASEYEFWAANWHTLDPYYYGWHRFHRQSPSVDVVYWMRYPNGDGNFIYPGAPIGAGPLVASVRLKQAREGVEDFEFLHLLEQLINEAGMAGLDIGAAQNVMDEAMTLVNIPCADGRYTTDYMPDPALLADIRHRVALNIEDLKQQLR